MKSLLIILFIPLILISLAIYRPLHERIVVIMEKYGREDVIKVLLMGGFTGLIKLMIQRI